MSDCRSMPGSAGHGRLAHVALEPLRRDLRVGAGGLQLVQGLVDRLLELRIAFAEGNRVALRLADRRTGLYRQLRLLAQVRDEEAVVDGGIDASRGEVLQVFRRA